MKINPKALDCIVCEGMTFREFWKYVSLELWREGEGFSGKRPGVDSGWQSLVVDNLVASGFIKANITQEITEDDWIEYDLLEDAEKYVNGLIELLFKEKEVHKNPPPPAKLVPRHKSSTSSRLDGKE